MKHTAAERDLIYRAILCKWGFTTQATLAMEEMAECIKALSKYQRKTCEKTLMDVAEEIADVRLMLNQMEYALEIQELCASMEDHKLDRVLPKIKEEMDYFEKLMTDKAAADAKEMDAINKHIEINRNKLTDPNKLCVDCKSKGAGCANDVDGKYPAVACSCYERKWWKFGRPL